jgi:hypothetical protein
MSKTGNPILAITAAAIAAGQPLAIARIRELRAASKRSATIYKAVFWIGIVIFNLALWAPLPFTLPKTTLYAIAFGVLAVALVVPICGLKKHQMSLELLKVNRETLKKKTVNETGRVYMDKVKALDRPLINAEFKLLHRSKWPDAMDQGDG